MSDKPRSFPLPLSSVVDKGARKAPVFAPVATPQTATQNAARHVPLPGQQRAAAVATPSKSHAYAQERAQPVASRDRPLVSDAIRHAMVQRVARQGVTDQVVLNALATVPRHQFMDPGLVSQAYIDASLPIGHQQTISQPYIVARMIEVLRHGGALRRVLEIGTGCGYQAAVLACVAQEVFSVERIKSLHELAKHNLRPLRVPNLRLHYGDGMLGLPQAAPFDGIILAAAGLQVPQPLLDQLSVGGRLVAPVGDRTQQLVLITRTGKAEWTSETLEDCHFVPLRAGTA
ncbi:protein-L-isoaspartate O-methyltransferase [Duganella sp. Leaf126]|uniref:protein-L-isoaspartate(D-aspartate) O-methyltransferase n=1 Tax=Duganella sp. Leaf126 TaxID=1736266 RepID=UPI0006FE8835|nr:protein-L-isoaspartate(D-aspartate) O-methyltransferase [Duganella sp. Leaf126]KQQ31941.1 protein-L-isoaspartate O-methyltransferase [Duganella sp. Leaf126]